MAEEGFFERWSRLKATKGDSVETAVPAVPPVPASAAAAQAVAAPEPAPAAPPATRPSPTLDDVARLSPDADFSAFVGRDVDKAVQRLALKKLFADPHFKVMDGLDMYMDDYNKPSPVSAAMLAALDHARGALRLPGQTEAARAEEGAAGAPAGARTGPAPEAADAASPAAAAGAGTDAASDPASDAASDPASGGASAPASDLVPVPAGRPPAPGTHAAPPDVLQSKVAPASSPGGYTAM